MNQLNHLIELFPKINTDRFETVRYIHNKALSFFIPKGPKYFVWFTYLNNKPICIFLSHENNEIQTIHHHYVAFKEELCIGTILYGTLIDKKFICENVYYHHGKPIKINDYFKKIDIMKEILSSIRQSDYLGSVSFFLPKICHGHLILEASNVPYVVYGILHIYSQPKLFVLTTNLYTFMFKRRIDLEDIYELFALDDKKQYVFHSTALVNDFKTSYFMKKLAFKKKKNYKNIEFSDSEDEEENVGELFVSCLYVPEFKKWKPYISKKKIADNISQIHNFEKKIFG